jgi:hypothetical protein
MLTNPPEDLKMKTEQERAAMNALESLLGDYWNIAYAEGLDQEVQGYAASETLSAIRQAVRNIVDADRAQRQAEPSEDCKHLLGELLAIVHRDGGHYTAANGFKKATEDAIQAVSMQRQAEPVALIDQIANSVLMGNTAPPPAQQRQAEPEGWTLAPAYRGYALLGLGQYVINHTRQDEPPELIISVATPEEKQGRAVGDERDNEADKQIRPDVMVVRVGFHSVAGLDALEAQLRHLRRVHFPASAAPPPAQVPLTDEQWAALAIIASSRKVSVSEVQRKLVIGYGKAQEICQSLVDTGLTNGLPVSPFMKAAHSSWPPQ